MNERQEEKAGREDGERQQWAKRDVEAISKSDGWSQPTTSSAFAITFRHLDRDNLNAKSLHTAFTAYETIRPIPSLKNHAILDSSSL